MYSSTKSHRRQHGSVIINTAIALSLIVIALIGTELGYLFFMKREFQKTADLAALAGAQSLKPNSCSEATTAAISNASQNLPAGFTLAASDVVCGRWDPVSRPTSPHFSPTNSGEKFNAVHVSITRTPAQLLAGILGNGGRQISVEAVAAQKTPRAALTIRSTLVSVDTTKSALLNNVLGKLLGTSLNVSIGGWNGLLGTNVKLLSFLDALAIELHIDAGNYDQVLSTNANVGVLLKAMINALQRSGNTAEVVLIALDELRVKANLAAAQPLIKLGDLLGVQTGTEAAGLQTDLQLFQLVQGIVQLANKKNAASVDIPVTVPGIGTVTTKVRVIEAPQISAIGNPELAALSPDGPDRIQVQTAQVRTLISVDLPGLSGITGLLNAVTNLLAPITSLLNNILSLDLQAILCLGCTQTRIVLVPENPIRLSINLNAASAKAKVTDVDCTTPSNSSLEVTSRTAAAELRVGQISDADATVFLSDGTVPVVRPIPLLDVETRTCTLILCGAWAKYSRTGLKVDTTVAATPDEYTYVKPPELDAPPAYHSLVAQDIVRSLSDTLSGLQLQTYKYSASAANHLGDLIGSATQLLSGVLTLVQGVITSLLSPLLDSLVNLLLNALGIQLAQADVGARLSCTRGAELVF